MNINDDSVFISATQGSQNTLASLRNMLSAAEMQMAEPVATWIATILKIGTVLQTELTYLRTMEVHVRQGTMTDEIWMAIQIELDNFRNKTVIEAGGTVGNHQGSAEVN